MGAHTRPTIIVITPVRNEAWVLEAFLTHCSSWADHIILADQHSTDGSREIAQRFPKVILIDNSDKEMNMAAARRRLFEAVDRIAGDKIVWAMDADEFLSDGFQRTAGWNAIIASPPGSIFCLKWQNLIGDYRHEIISAQSPAEWVCHFGPDEKTSALYAQNEQRAIHEARVPCVASATYTDIDDIRFVHLARLNVRRLQNKNDFYQVSTVDKLPQSISAISIYRFYHTRPGIQACDTPAKITTADGADISSLVHAADNGQHYVEEMASILREKGCKKFRRLCIWDNPDLRGVGIRYIPPLGDRMLCRYLQFTDRFSKNIFVHVMDKVLKTFF